mmetsp:Transcript_111291/g.314144  ORF Transcript_111291/g.314144 Transcript_111291/m.314144 type:complete len:201 (-) Transcript_111291:39-641(-)
MASLLRKSNSALRASRSKSVVASSSRTTSRGSFSLRLSSTRRRSPSERLPQCRESSRSRPNALCSRPMCPSSETASGPPRPSSSHTLAKSVPSPEPTPPAAPRQPPWIIATLPPELVRKGSPPHTLIFPAGAIFCPESSSSKVDLPAPLWPTTTQRAPAGNVREIPDKMSSPPGINEKDKSSTWTAIPSAASKAIAPEGA